jgi:hypothetical protein
MKKLILAAFAVMSLGAAMSVTPDAANAQSLSHGAVPSSSQQSNYIAAGNG